jgi:sporulation protein YlmC with PRC-barrel domain
VDGVDADPPIGYSVLEKDVPVLAADGEQVGTVDHVVAAVEQDIFHGLVIRTGQGRRFVGAEDVVMVHEHRVELRIDSLAAEQLPEPGGAAPVYTEDLAEVKGWRHWANKLSMRGDWRRGG